jgi:hypothetical protein
MAGYDLSEYVDVAERLRTFFDRYPDGSIQANPPTVVELDGKRFITVTASAYRNPADARPAVASAWEVWPGRTPYTKDSEAMNCETSAVGRALAFLGLNVRRSIATAQDVANRREPPKIDKAVLARLRAQLAKHASTTAAKQELVEVILGHPTGALADLTVVEGDEVGRALDDLAAGRTRLELDESGAARIVTIDPSGGVPDGVPG